MAETKIRTREPEPRLSGFVMGQSPRRAEPAEAVPKGRLDTVKKQLSREQEGADRYAWWKTLSRKIAGGLAATTTDDPRARKAYRRAYYECLSTIHQVDGKHSARTCKQRACEGCQRRRMAKYAREYGAYVESWGAAFVTLTWPNCGSTREELGASLDEAEKAWRAVQKRVRRSYGKKAFRAMRVLEITWPRPGEFNPHFHLIVDRMDVAWFIVQAWTEAMAGADRGAQDVRPCDDGTVVELFKYTMKGVTEGRLIPFEVRHQMVQGLKGRRTVRPVGFRKAEALEYAETMEELVAPIEQPGDIDEGWPEWKRIGETVAWQWDDGTMGWVDRATGDVLAEAQLDDKKRAMLGRLPTDEILSSGLRAKRIEPTRRE